MEFKLGDIVTLNGEGVSRRSTMYKLLGNPVKILEIDTEEGVYFLEGGLRVSGNMIELASPETKERGIETPMGTLEKLKQEIDELDFEGNADKEFVRGYIEAKIDVLELIDQLTVPEIPIYVAEYIEKCKSNGESLGFSLSYIQKYGWEDEKHVEFKIYNWVTRKNGEEEYARAWLDGYNILVEKYYVLDLKNMIPMLLKSEGKVGRAGTHLRINEPGKDKVPFQLTEEEIKSFDERYWAFAEPIKDFRPGGASYGMQIL